MNKTDFGGHSFDFVNGETTQAYQPTVQVLFAAFGGAGFNPSEPQVVADAIRVAASDGLDTLRYRAGADAVELLDRRNTQDEETFFAVFVTKASFSAVIAWPLRMQEAAMPYPGPRLRPTY